MYFSLSNLSFLDICYSSNSVPFSALRNYPTISYTSCYAQMVISLFLGMTECLLLAVMAYDRFIAISNPLHYTIIINNQVCIQLAAVTWASAFLLAEIPITAILAHFCGHNLIKHFTCETQALLKLICLETPVRLILGLVIGIFTLPLPFTFILISGTCIVVAMLKIRSAEARLKAFSTCGSHLTAVTEASASTVFWNQSLGDSDASGPGPCFGAF